MKKKLLFAFLAVLLTLGIGAQKVHADDEVTYNVYVDGGLNGDVSPADPFEGAYGTILYIEQNSDGSEISIYTIVNGSQSSSPIYSITINDTKYYIKGLCLSGQYLSEDDIKVGTSITVDQDIYLVPVYGVKGNRYSYKVYYQTTDGTNLYDKEYDEFYCNANETVVVGAKYFDEYKLKQVIFFDGEDSTTYNTSVGFQKIIYADNVYTFTFVYEKVKAEENITYDERYEYEQGQTVTPGGTTPGGTTPEEEPVPDIIDIDDPDTPTTEPDKPEPTPTPEPTPPEPEPTNPSFWEILFSTPWLLGSVIAAILMIIFFLIFLFKRKKENEQ